MHYKDGKLAKVGDLVKGTTYNTPKGSVHVGILLGITPGSDACNCRVAILQRRDIGELKLTGAFAAGTPYLMEGRTSEGTFLVHHENLYTEDVKTSLVGAKVDYSQCSHLELVHRDEPVAD